MARRILALVLGFCISAFVSAQEQIHKTDHVIVRYTGIELQHAQSIARIVEAARKHAIDNFGFDLPDVVSVIVDCNARNHNHLETDGRDRITLLIPNIDALRRSSQTGVFHLYGMCHELGHMAMYRAIPRHDWMTTGAAEGWAHYIGSRLVDMVYESEGQAAWWDAYDYRSDGMQRLDRQIAAAGRDETVAGAKAWKELAAIAGDRKLAAIFTAWGQTKLDLRDPAAALGPALAKAADNPKVTNWWNRESDRLVSKLPMSDFHLETLAASKLAGQPKELARDDGSSAGMRSFNGGGHAVAFDAPEGQWYLTAVKFYGSRYGTPRPPAEDFRVWLCDEQGKVIRECTFPYAKFERGQPKWVTLEVEPTQVPAKFLLCVGFNPSGSKGVYAHFDAAPDGDSRVGLPTYGFEKFDKGDWLIRATVDRAK
ncbi:MAG: hypothetical protein ACHRHE_16730 [Tepidisphaerales bacterium]